MEREGKLFSHTLLLGIASVISKAITFFMLPLYTTALDPSEFGVVDILISTAVLLLPIVSLHAPEALFRFRLEGERGALAGGGIYLLIGFLLFLVSVPLFGFSSLLSSYRWILFFYVVTSVLRSFLAHLLRSDGAFALYAVQQIFCALLTVTLQFLFLKVYQYGVVGYLLAVILADAVTSLMLFPYLLAQVKGEIRPSKSLRKQMMRYAFPMIPGSVLWWLMAVADRYLLLAFQGEAATGVLAAAGKLPGLVSLLIGIFMESWHYAALGRKEGKEILFGRIYALLVPSVLTIGVVLSLLARPLVFVFLADSYASAAVVVPLLVFGAVCGGLANFVGSVYTLRMRSSATLFTALVCAMGNVLLSFWLLPTLGVLGAALSTALSFAALLFIRLWHTRRLLAFPRLFLLLSSSLLLFFFGALLIGSGRFGTGAFLSLLSLLPMARKGIEALHFLWRRGLAFLSQLKKSEKYRKKI